LEDDLLGQLRGDAAQRTGVAIEPDLAAHLRAGRQCIGLGERDLVERVLDGLIVGHDRLVDVGRDLAGLLVQLPAHILLGLVELACGQGDGLLDGAYNDGGVNALFLAQELDTLVQNAGHTLLALSVLRVRRDSLESQSGSVWVLCKGTGFSPYENAVATWGLSP
jgi:hypothetical protein